MCDPTSRVGSANIVRTRAGPIHPCSRVARLLRVRSGSVGLIRTSSHVFVNTCNKHVQNLFYMEFWNKIIFTIWKNPCHLYIHFIQNRSRTCPLQALTSTWELGRGPRPAGARSNQPDWARLSPTEPDFFRVRPSPVLSGSRHSHMKIFICLWFSHIPSFHTYNDDDIASFERRYYAKNVSLLSTMLNWIVYVNTLMIERKIVFLLSSISFFLPSLLTLLNSHSEICFPFTRSSFTPCYRYR